MASQSYPVHAQPSQEQKKLQCEHTLQAAESLQQDIHNTVDEIHAAVERL